MIENCSIKEYLLHLTFTSNFAETPTCMGYLWYLALDMQLYIFAPFILTLINQKPKIGILFCSFLICFSIILRAFYCQIYNICNKSDVDIPVNIFYK